MNILSKILIQIIKGYKFFISPFFSNSCKFTPSCSSYALECFKKYNLLKAIIKTTLRIIKCNPWFSTGGYDSPLEKSKDKWI